MVARVSFIVVLCSSFFLVGSSSIKWTFTGEDDEIHEKSIWVINFIDEGAVIKYTGFILLGLNFEWQDTCTHINSLENALYHSINFLSIFWEAIHLSEDSNLIIIWSYHIRKTFWWPNKFNKFFMHI